MSRLAPSIPLAFTLALAASAALAQAPAPIADDRPPPQGFVTVVGEGVAWTMPEVLTVRLVVATDGKTPRQAFEANAARVSAVVEAAGAAGVPQSQMRSERIQAGPRDDGFQVRHVLVARVRGVSRVGDLMEKATQAGATEVSGLDFGPEETAAAARDARQRAARDAEDRARSYAQGLGLRLGRVVSVNDADRGAEPRAQDPSPALEVARAETRARVTVVYEIETPLPKP